MFMAYCIIYVVWNIKKTMTSPSSYGCTKLTGNALRLICVSSVVPVYMAMTAGGRVKHLLSLTAKDKNADYRCVISGYFICMAGVFNNANKSII